MARRKKYSDFRNFDKTYNRYVKLYYQKARQIYKYENGLPSRSRLPKTVTKKVLNSYMKGDPYDPIYNPSGGKPMTRMNLANTYRSLRDEKIEKGTTEDIVQHIVNKQAFQFSRKQYVGYSSAIDELDLDIKKAKYMDFMIGRWNQDDYFKIVKERYHEIKDFFASKGYTGKELTDEVTRNIGELYFDSTPRKERWN